MAVTPSEFEADAPMFDLGKWLMERRVLMDRGEAGWLAVLADFDDSEAWAADGQLSCADWLMWRVNMARSTAFEKLRIAHELRRRPKVAAALEAGEISYSAARALTRIDRPDPEVDDALLELAKHRPIIELERAVRCYQLYHDQDNDSADFLRRYDSRGVHLYRGFDGMGGAKLVLTDVEVAELNTVLQMFIDRSAITDSAADESSAGDASPAGAGPVEGSSAGDASPAGTQPVEGSSDGDASLAGAGPVDGSSGGDASLAGAGPVEGSSDGDASLAGAGPVDGSSGGDFLPAPAVEVNPWWHRRADAFMEMVRTAMAYANAGQAVGADRYLLHARVDVKSLTWSDSEPAELCGELLGGQPLRPATLSQMACDASIVTHLVDGDEPLQLGRKTRVWNTSQRRAITVRDGRRCRFPGCRRRNGDIHHIQWWTKGGATDINNGVFICDRHHTLVHNGYQIEGDANHELSFYRPDGTLLGTTTPPAAPRYQAAA